MSTRQAQNPALAATLICAATAFIAATMLVAKTLGTDAAGPALHPLQITFGRFAFAFLAIGTVFLATRQKIETVHWRFHVGRTSFGWMGVSLMFASVIYIPLADASAISFLNPVFAMMFAIPFLGEKVGKWRWLAAAIAFVGAMILLRPTPASFQPGALLALMAALCMGAELIFIRQLAIREAPLQILCVNNFLGLCIATATAYFVWVAPTPLQWALMAALGCLMALAQTFFVNGMARADASFVAPFSYATLIFAALYDFAVFNAIPDRVSILGATIIIAGALLLALREARASAT